MTSQNEPNPVKNPLPSGAWTVNPNFSWKKLAQGCIILDLKKGCYFTLNDTAFAVWNGILESKDWGSIASELALEYEVSEEQANNDVQEVVAMLQAEGVLTPRE